MGWTKKALRARKLIHGLMLLALVAVVSTLCVNLLAPTVALLAVLSILAVIPFSGDP